MLDDQRASRADPAAPYDFGTQGEETATVTDAARASRRLRFMTIGGAGIRSSDGIIPSKAN